ncbi:MAG: hypothetical protein R3326_08530 [Gemmatimonadota bacterium]|nr:hypothetical protein [Gemmatimonadota bacterium]
MRRTGSWIPILVALALALATAVGACGGDEAGEETGAEETPAAEQEVEVTGVTLGSSVGADNRVTQETGTFAPSDTIYTSVETEGVAESAELTARWTYEDGQTIDETSRTIAPNGPEVTEFHVATPDGWPTGEYQVTILLDGEEAETASFTVE